MSNPLPTRAEALAAKPMTVALSAATIDVAGISACTTANERVTRVKQVVDNIKDSTFSLAQWALDFKDPLWAVDLDAAHRELANVHGITRGLRRITNSNAEQDRIINILSDDLAYFNDALGRVVADKWRQLAEDRASGGGGSGSGSGSGFGPRSKPARERLMPGKGTEPYSGPDGVRVTRGVTDRAHTRRDFAIVRRNAFALKLTAWLTPRIHIRYRVTCPRS